MSATDDIVMQTTAVVTNLLKPLIDNGACEIRRQPDRIAFLMKSGSAAIVVLVSAHPALEEEALVEIIGTLAKVELENVDPQVLLSALVLNRSMNGFAIAADPDLGLLCLRGTLIGSTMDKLEFDNLLNTLAQTADDLDDKFVAALQKTDQEGQSDAESGTVTRLKQMTTKLLSVLVENEKTLFNSFIETLPEADRIEFAKLANDEKMRASLHECAFGKTAAGLVALMLADDIANDDRKQTAKKIWETLPDNDLLVRLVAFAVMNTATMVAKALKLDPDLVQKRLKAVFSE